MHNNIDIAQHGQHVLQAQQHRAQHGQYVQHAHQQRAQQGQDALEQQLTHVL